jgi:hypothetical protein
MTNDERPSLAFCVRLDGIATGWSAERIEVRVTSANEKTDVVTCLSHVFTRSGGLQTAVYF